MCVKLCYLQTSTWQLAGPLCLVVMSGILESRLHKSVKFHCKPKLHDGWGDAAPEAELRVRAELCARTGDHEAPAASSNGTALAHAEGATARVRHTAQRARRGRLAGRAFICRTCADPRAGSTASVGGRGAPGGGVGGWRRRG